MSKFYDIAKAFVADESRKALSKPFVYEGYPYASDGKIAYWGHVMCPEQESEDADLAVHIKKLILEAHKAKQFSFEFDDEFVGLAKEDYEVKLGEFLTEEMEERERYKGDIMICPYCGEKVYYTGYDLIEVEELQDPKESDFLYAVEIEGNKYNWRYIQMMMNAIPNGEWFITKSKIHNDKFYYGLMRHSEDATAYMMALFPNTETQLKANIKKGQTNEQ